MQWVVRCGMTRAARQCPTTPKSYAGDTFVRDAMGRVVWMDTCLPQSREYPTTPKPRSASHLLERERSSEMRWVVDVDGHGIRGKGCPTTPKPWSSIHLTSTDVGKPTTPKSKKSDGCTDQTISSATWRLAG
ncbi:uncharacterized protein LOC121368991 [Gigantopelta aegis]|uniref:uncharacterized protein LOC121368991 n=1 Tax=Gigantopelta aegis TaxID=1735272 RepID=UPI001B88A033|nr:uncharacterized protein LOC121368991 [Gigantopelta aegis]